MTRITISLSDEEKTALRALSEKEFRDPRMQAALIIRRELERQGLVESVRPMNEGELNVKKIKQRRNKKYDNATE